MSMMPQGQFSPSQSSLEKMSEEFQEKLLNDAVDLVVKDPIRFGVERSISVDREIRKIRKKTSTLRSQVLATNKLCSYEKKLDVLVEVLQEIIPIKSGDLDLMSKKAGAIVRVVAELNRMQGHYAPEKHMMLNANLSQEQSVKINDLIAQCEGEY